MTKRKKPEPVWEHPWAYAWATRPLGILMAVYVTHLAGRSTRRSRSGGDVAKKPEASSWSTSDGPNQSSGGAWKRKAKSSCPMVAAPPIAVGIGLLALVLRRRKR